MREKLIFLWRRLTKVKVLYPLIKFIRFFAGTKIFNVILDFLEVKIFKTSYQETKDFVNENKRRIVAIIKGLEDEKSRFVYKNIWKYRATHKRGYLKGIVDKEQYFDEELIKFGSREGFVDCGAYKGDTIREFCRHLPDEEKYDFIIAFEPDAYNFKILKKYVRKKKKKKIECYQLGTWGQKAVLNFRGNTEEGCMIDRDGDTVINTETIDKIVGRKKATYIKMDVEGAELESLIGAKKVIEREHPRLAVSIYHSDQDMIDIIEYIKREYPFYKLYVRHYTHFYADTVLYAIDRGQC